MTASDNQLTLSTSLTAKTKQLGPKAKWLSDLSVLRYVAHSFRDIAVPFPAYCASVIRFRMMSAVSVRVRYRASDSVSASKA